MRSRVGTFLTPCGSRSSRVNAWTRQHVSASPESGDLHTGRPASEAAAADGARAPLCGKPACCSLFGPRFAAAVQMWLLPTLRGLPAKDYCGQPGHCQIPLMCELPAAFRCLRQLPVRLVP